MTRDSYTGYTFPCWDLQKRAGRHNRHVHEAYLGVICTGQTGESQNGKSSMGRLLLPHFVEKSIILCGHL